nr:CBM_HP1_G0009910.mRNA.1.CDS.1 [Saccharomyces cerevisiae]
MAMLRIIDSIQSATTKSRISGKGAKWFARERNGKHNFPILPENMNVLQFLGFFRSDEIKHLSSMVFDVFSAQRGVFTQYRLCRAVHKCSSPVSSGQKVSYRGWLGKPSLERMLRNDEEYKEYLEDPDPSMGRTL